MPRKTRSTQSPKPTKSTRPRSAAKPKRGEVRSGTKIGALITLLRRPEGAALAVLMKATGWQAHSVRGAIAGTLKKKHGLAITATRGSDGQRVYAIR